MIRTTLKRSIAAAIIVLITAGCGDDAGGSSREQRANQRRGQVDVFAAAASEISISSTALFVRADNGHIDELEAVLQRTSGGRVIVSALPPRTQLVQLAVERMGWNAETARAVRPLLRSDTVAARSGPGWKLWLPVRARDRTRAKRIVAANPQTSSLSSGILRIATSPAAWNAPVPDDESVLDQVSRWEPFIATRRARAAIVIAVDAGRIGALAVDDAGIAIVGRTASSGSCEASGDAVETLSSAPASARFAAADATDRGTGAGALGALLDTSTTTVRWLGSIDSGSVRVNRIRDALVGGASQLTSRMARPDAHADIVAVEGAGGDKPRAIAITRPDATPLAQDPTFNAVRDAARSPKAARAWWIDLDDVIRAAAQSGLTGLELGVAEGLGAGIDGVLAWETCDGRFGARIAIPAAN